MIAVTEASIAIETRSGSRLKISPDRGGRDFDEVYGAGYRLDAIMINVTHFLPQSNRFTFPGESLQVNGGVWRMRNSR